MPNKTGIEYVQYTSNPIYAVSVETGKRGHHCVKVNELCRRCYAEAINKRWGTGLAFTAQNESKIRFALSERELEELGKLDARLFKKGETARVFVGDMTDLFQPNIPRAFLFQLLDTIREFKALTVLLLTKRVETMLEVVNAYRRARRLRVKAFRRAFAHVHMGLSVGEQRGANKDVTTFLRAPFAVLWLSVEPLLEPVDLTRVATGRWTYGQVDVLSGYLCGDEPDAMYDWDADPNGWVRKPAGQWKRGPHGIAWVVVGGESGPGARQLNVEWVSSILSQSRAAGVPVFVKQLGARPIDGRSGEPEVPPYEFFLSDRKGGDPSEWPADLRVREFPAANRREATA